MDTATPKVTTMLPIKWNPPTLSCDDYLQGKMIPRGRLERRVIWNLLHNLLAAGWKPTEVDDGEELHQIADTGSADELAKATMERVFAVDESRIFFERCANSPRQWVFVVLGNDGWDSVNDFTLGTGFAEVLDNFIDHVEEMC